MKLFDLMSALLFLILNVFFPGLIVLTTIGTSMSSGLRMRMWRWAFVIGACRSICQPDRR